MRQNIPITSYISGGKMSQGNVIDIQSRVGKSGNLKKKVKSKAPVLDMTERRNQIIESERREVKRTILTEFIGAFIVVPQRGLVKVSIYDISESGIAIDIDEEIGCFEAGEEIAVRVYLNQQTYFPFIVNVNHARENREEASYRHGCNFVKGTLNNEALHHFVKFIETVSASLERDTGDIMVSNLNK